MRKEFNELVEIMVEWHLFQKDDEVDFALTNLSNKIDEVEKRMECATKCAKEIGRAIGHYQNDIDNGLLIKMDIGHLDSILHGSHDVENALNLDDNMCVSDNWYNLFSPKEEPKPIAVGNIEYDFPEEVYTIGNADNTEIIGDVYQSVFINLDKLGVIVTENDNGFTFGKANYVVKDNALIPLIIANQIDLSKVPIKKEVFMTFHSSWGEIDCDVDGNVIEVRGDDDEDNYLNDIAVFDLAEYYTFLNSKNITMGEADDILAIGFWKKDNTYHEAKKDWRKGIFGEEPPTMLCNDPIKHEIINNIISQLKEIDVDGETMEHIIRSIGMDEQILKQLFAQTTNDEIDYLHDVRNGKG